MKVAVRYCSRGGNTKKLADAIAAAVGSTAYPATKALDEEVDLLFLGGAIYAGSIDKSLKEFVLGLKPEGVKKVAVFSNAAGPKNIQKQIEELLATSGIPLCQQCFCCRGQFLFAHKGRPNQQDCADAAAFATSLL